MTRFITISQDSLRSSSSKSKNTKHLTCRRRQPEIEDMKSTCPASDENLKSKNEKNLTGKRRETKMEERKYLTVKRRERESLTRQPEDNVGTRLKRAIDLPSPLPDDSPETAAIRARTPCHYSPAIVLFPLPDWQRCYCASPFASTTSLGLLFSSSLTWKLFARIPQTHLTRLSLSLSRHSPALFSSQETMPRVIPGEWRYRALYPASFHLARNNTRVIPGECGSFSHLPLFSLRKKRDLLRFAGNTQRTAQYQLHASKEKELYELLEKTSRNS